MALTPYLQAEQDFRYILREDTERAAEALAMNGVHGWKVGESTYNSQKRWLPPATDTMPRFA
eukprot:SAG25_NODE_838_length_5128_cov_5.187314_5_plen_62_part_00